MQEDKITSRLFTIIKLFVICRILMINLKVNAAKKYSFIKQVNISISTINHSTTEVLISLNCF